MTFFVAPGADKLSSIHRGRASREEDLVDDLESLIEHGEKRRHQRRRCAALLTYPVAYFLLTEIIVNSP